MSATGPRMTLLTPQVDPRLQSRITELPGEAPGGQALHLLSDREQGHCRPDIPMHHTVAAHDVGSAPVGDPVELVHRRASAASR